MSMRSRNKVIPHGLVSQSVRDHSPVQTRTPSQTVGGSRRPKRLRIVARLDSKWPDVEHNPQGTTTAREEAAVGAALVADVSAGVVPSLTSAGRTLRLAGSRVE